MEYLEGGRQNQIARVGETIIRPAGIWSPTVHRVLNHVRKQGFLKVPEPQGFDNEGNEIVSFIPGDVSNYPLSKAAKSNDALISAAKLLRAFHDATTTFIHELVGDEIWMLPPRQPIEVICHGDYAPYNVVLHGTESVAIIDFDTIHPASRNWDIAYALYRWASLKHPNNPDNFCTEAEKMDRAQQFCDAYGLSKENRVGLIQLTIERLQKLVGFMQAEADKGNETFKANLIDGHHHLYVKDIEYLKHRGDVYQKGILL